MQIIKKILNFSIKKMSRERWLVLMPYIIFIVAFFSFCARNLDPVTFPSLYAEDGVWTANLLTHGFYDTAFHTRVFPILGFILFYQIGIFFVDLLFNHQLIYLPLVYFFLSNIFCALLVVSVYKIFREYLSSIALLTVMLSILLLPVGGDANEIFGRILNLGFIFPFFQVVLLISLLRENISISSVAAILIFAAISGLTFPIGLGLSGFFAIFMLYLSLDSKTKWRYYLNSFFLLIPIIFAIFLLSSDTFVNKGGADLPVRMSSFIEFAIARSSLYPIVFSYYRNLSDVVVIGIFVLIVTIVVISIFNNKANSSYGKLRSVTAVLWASFLIYLIAMVVMRIGLTSLFNNYTSTFPDRYFTGLNLLFITALIFSLDQLKIKKNIYIFILLPVIITAPKRFEFSNPSIKMDAVPPWTVSSCVSYKNDLKKISAINIPPKGWSMELSYNLMNRFKLSTCSPLPFYNLYPLSEFQKPIVIYPNIRIDRVKNAITDLKVNNGITLRQVSHHIQVAVTNSDPSLLFSINKTNQLNESVSFISIIINSNVDGNIQLYYRLKDDNSYSESKSVYTSIGLGENIINISISHDVITDGIRLDFPDIIGAYYQISF
jgi:hypothetical protein